MPDSKLSDALRVARMYYYQNLNTAAIARELDVSRSTVSRLLSYAREQGIVEIRIQNPTDQTSSLEDKLRYQFDIDNVKVVSVSESVSDRQWLERVATFAARYLNTVIEPHNIIGISWGTTICTIARHLRPKPMVGINIVQLNGAGNIHTPGLAYAGEILLQYARNYRGKTHLLPVPTFFDESHTKNALWEETGIRRILDMHSRADILLYSIGPVNNGLPSHIYGDGFLSADDYADLEREKVVADIGTVFFRANGRAEGIRLNGRSSGPDLDLFRHGRRAICVVTGLNKVRALHAALKGRLMTDLIVDEPTARSLLEFASRQYLLPT